MQNDILIIDEFVSPSIQDQIESLCFSPYFSWYYNATAGYSKDKSPENIPKNVVDSFQFTHRVFDEGAILSSSFPAFEPLLKALPFSEVSVIRIKLNLTTQIKNVTKENFGSPHTDCKVELDDNTNYQTAIYYVNDSDGDTIIFNEKDFSKNLSVKARITPKKGRIVIFDGHLLHSPSIPLINEVRCVINLNFISNKNAK